MLCELQRFCKSNIFKNAGLQFELHFKHADAVDYWRILYFPFVNWMTSPSALSEFNALEIISLV